MPKDLCSQFALDPEERLAGAQWTEEDELEEDTAGEEQAYLQLSVHRLRDDERATDDRRTAVERFVETLESPREQEVFEISPRARLRAKLVARISATTGDGKPIEAAVYSGPHSR